MGYASVAQLQSYFDPHKLSRIRDLETRFAIEHQRHLNQSDRISELSAQQRELENTKHDHRLREANTKAASDAIERSFSGLQKLEESRIESIFEHGRQWSQTRADITKMLAGAVIQEKLAQKQHARDMEKLGVQLAHESERLYSQQLHELARMDFKRFCGELLDLCKQGQQKKAESVVDDILKSWK